MKYFKDAQGGLHALDDDVELSSLVSFPASAALIAETEWRSLSSPAPTDEQIRATAKAARAAAVDAIKVTTQAGHTFDGDEVSQGRMARAIISLQATGTPSVTWVLADNSVIEASAAELTEALSRSGAAQVAVWVIP